MSRKDKIGGACAALALCFIAWLSLDGLDRADCRDLTADLALPIDASLTYTPEVSRCISKLNLQSPAKS